MQAPVPIEEALRRAVNSGDFAAAEDLTRAYVAALQTALRQLPPAEGRLRLAEALRLVEWSRRCLCAARVRVGEKLRLAHRAATYCPGPPERVHTWKLLG